MQALWIALLMVLPSGCMSQVMPGQVNCSMFPAGGVAQWGLPCPGNKVDVPLPGKPGVRILPIPGQKPDPNTCPSNAEGKPYLLNDEITPITNFYVRSHGQVPKRALTRDMTGWNLTIDGDVIKTKQFTMAELQAFPVYSRQYILECAGNGRHGYNPNVEHANQWTVGAVGNGNWTGVLLKDVLQSLGLKSTAKYVGWYGEDKKCKGEGVLISRGIPIEKALDNYTMLVWAMNGEPLPAYHGFPLRLIAPGFPGAAQGKWLYRLWIRNQTHDGAKMAAPSYRLPAYPGIPGAFNISDPAQLATMKIITQMGVKSVITKPTRCLTTKNTTFRIEGKTWSGAGDVNSVEVAYDGGHNWHHARVSKPVNKYSWQSWWIDITLPSQGVWRIFSRATDHTGATQPMFAPYWNPKGYMNNAVMELTITVTK